MFHVIARKSRLLRWNINHEPGVLSRNTFHADIAAVFLDSAVADRQSESRALADILGCEEWVKNAAQMLRGNAGPVIFESDAQPWTALHCGSRRGSLSCDLRTDADDALFTECVKRIRKKIDEDLLEQIGIGRDHKGTGGPHDLDPNRLFLKSVFQERLDIAEQGQNIDAAKHRFAPARKLQKLPDDGGDPIALGADDLKIVFEFFGTARAAQEIFGATSEEIFF